ncbi:Uncharacterised protein [Streptococcus pyogenes]|uniref:hypothetical protein n=1 Tax=Streptococcus pyogenes TaxID=1314 RepID=UPI00109D418D|nr:hypothetical protein [Streptococcus pyogenes]VGQ36088.1 Uncharacterised protein [Streptococcus pyogenes]VGV33653.1 Uncharacterised protein [Streptococcus pyogenes]VGV56486.1 Uncharacterised protein [Streptococcus pyogenes]VGV62859.1 Uncharacterised protein [Streptococcus pyogenes]VGV63234.1 Uncharacterised protein [Streptococcus pyogenes]
MSKTTEYEYAIEEMIKIIKTYSSNSESAINEFKRLNPHLSDLDLSKIYNEALAIRKQQDEPSKSLKSAVLDLENETQKQITK